jgi:hypothetical protein
MKDFKTKNGFFTGNVGIGTTDADTPLHVDVVGQNDILKLTRDDGSNGTLTLNFGGANANFNCSDGGYKFATANATDAMTINSDGNVGIGTTNPVSAHNRDSVLVVGGGTGTETSGITLGTGSGYANGPYEILTSSEGSSASLRISDGTDSRLTIRSNGNVGIGINNPNLTGLQLGTALVVSSSTGGDIVAHKSGSSVNIGDICGSLLIANSDTDGAEDHFVGMWGKASSTNGSQDLHFAAGRSGYEGDAPHMTIKSDGNVGIGATNPSAELEVGDGTSSKAIKIKSGGGSSGDLIFDSASDEGMLRYEHTTDSMRFHTNGSEQVRIDSSGNVGIGTTSPIRPLEIQFTDATAYAGSGSGNALRVRNTSQATDTFSGLEMFAGQNSAGGANIARIFAVKESNTSTATSLAFTTRASNQVLSEAMRINSAGNVGIGTANPSTKLHVPQGGSTIGGVDLSNASILVGSTDTGIGIDDNEIIKRHDTNGNSFNIGSQGTNGSISFKTGADTANGNIPFDRMTIDSDGNVGIGTTNPTYKLHLTDSGARNVILTSSEGLTSDGYGGYISTVSKASGASAAHGLLIGCFRPSTSDDFVGMIRFHQRNLVKQHLWFDNSGQLRVSTNGAHIGSDHEDSTVIGTQTSDERLKNIEDNFEYGLDKVMQLKPIAYKLKEDESQVRKLGFGAQTTQAIVPEVVFKSSMCIDGYDQDPEDEHGQIPRSEDTTLGMEYVQLIPVLTKAIQEQQAIIEDLKSQNESLVARIEALEG